MKMKMLTLYSSCSSLCLVKKILRFLYAGDRRKSVFKVDRQSGRRNFIHPTRNEGGEAKKRGQSKEA